MIRERLYLSWVSQHALARDQGVRHTDGGFTGETSTLIKA